MRLRAEHANPVWSYDFVEDRTHDGRKYRMLNLVDEFTRECLAIRVARRLKSVDVTQAAGGVVHAARCAGVYPLRQWPGVHRRGCPRWIAALSAKTAYMAPGSPWENGYVERFNARFA